MAINFRNQIFETNSSSTHSICISQKEEKLAIPKEIKIDLNRDEYEFGWSYEKWDTPEEKLAYLILGIVGRNWYYTSLVEATAQIEKVLTRLKEWGVENVVIKGINFDLYSKDIYLSTDCNSYLDHSAETGELIEYLLERGDNLKNFLFSSKSFILGGNDNEEGYPEIEVVYPHAEFFKGN